MERDKLLISQFMQGWNREKQTKYSLQSCPDKNERQKPAADAVYSDPYGHTIAIEHTRIEPFEGALGYEAGPFRTIWEPLKDSPLPEHHIWLRVARSEVEKSSTWQQDSSLVKDWFLRERDKFPLVEALYEISRPPNPSFHVCALTQHIPDFPGMVSIASIVGCDPKLAGLSRPLVPRVKRAIQDKLPKLSKTQADQHILLLELVDRSISNLWDLAKAIEILNSCFPDLDKVAVWATDDSQSGIEGTPSFAHLRDGQPGHSFLVTQVLSIVSWRGRL